MTGAPTGGSLGFLVVAAATCAALVLAGPREPTAAAAHAGPAVARPYEEARFPHVKHVRLFPTCLGCHGGVLADDSARGQRPPMTAAAAGQGATSVFPSPADCATCHDGQLEKRVEWDGPRTAPSNLRYSHVAHERDARLGPPDLQCRSCHALPRDTLFMAVARARPEPCVACHGHPAPTHLAESSPCATCHVTLTRAAALTAARVQAFPRPPSHDAPDFAARHAPTIDRARAQCAVCHARESCERCHANAARIPQIAALERDARAASFVATLGPASYAVPASHARREWSYAHGQPAAAAPQGCANCHTQPSCTTCHVGALGARVIAQLPPADPRRGVRLRGQDPSWTPSARGVARPALLLQGRASAAMDTMRRHGDTASRVRVHPPGFATRHGSAAATQRTSCSGCHEPKRFCVDCHDGESRRRFHAANFVARHPSEAYARQRECTACHSREAFCGACHQRLGLQSQGRTAVAYHDAQPLWLLQHGRAARMGMESCTTCHRERDCTQCHAQTGWGVNPHGPGFEARRMSARNAPMCRVCHLSDPLARAP